MGGTGEEMPRGEVVPGWKQVLAGTAGGICQVLVGHPFNTVKANIQASATPTGGMAVLRDIIKTDGPRGLYKGMVPPLVGTGAMTACVFFANGYLLEKLGGCKDPSKTDTLPMTTIATCGALAGLAQVSICTPIELVMIRLQTQGKQKLYSGPLDCALKLVRQGGPQALYKGFTATCLRDPPNYFMYFFGYETVKRLQVPAGGTSADLNSAQLLAAGGFAGVGAQIVQLPMDVVKTRMQSDTTGAYKSTLECYSKTFAEAGLGGFYKGLGPVLLRAFPANAVTFFGFECALAALR